MSMRVLLLHVVEHVLLFSLNLRIFFLFIFLLDIEGLFLFLFWEIRKKKLGIADGFLTCQENWRITTKLIYWIFTLARIGRK